MVIERVGGVVERGEARDYSSQWAEYYRALGMVREAEIIEHQMSAREQSSQDYSAQWAEYYRSVQYSVLYYSQLYYTDVLYRVQYRTVQWATSCRSSINQSKYIPSLSLLQGSGELQGSRGNRGEAQDEEDD